VSVAIGLNAYDLIDDDEGQSTVRCRIFAITPMTT
jgi:hypothetical protein